MKKTEMILEIVRVKQEVMERPSDYSTGMYSSEIAGNFGIREIGDEASEVIMVVALNTKNKINAVHRVFAGGLNTIIAQPREIFRTALMNNAASVMIYHNHPSGDLEPSSADIAFTNRIERAGEILGIELLDHIIVGHDSYYSLKEHGNL